MSTPQQLFQRFIDEQRSEYGRSLPDKVRQIEVRWRFVASGGGEADSFAELERLAHTLAGTSGTLGFAAASQAAKALELLVQRAMQDAASWAALHSEIEQAIGYLQNSLPHTDPAPIDTSAGTPADDSVRAKDVG